jgi:lysophospholipase L1-like esterase
VFEDLDADGLLDPGEPGVAGLPLLIWRGDALRFPGTTGPDGTFSVAADQGPHQLELGLPTGWRLSFPDQTWDPPVAGPTDDVILPRWGSAPGLRANAEAPADLELYSLGDSIPAGFNLCAEDTDYVPDVAADVSAITGEATPWRNEAIPGAHAEDLLTPRLDPGIANPQFVPDVIAAAPQLVTINVGGNDYLDTDGDLAANLQALIDTRATLQEVVSTLLWELPASDLVLNTVYDNEAEDCATSDFHARTTPLWNQVLRWIGTGQVRSVALAEAALDFAHQDVTRTDCAGAEGRICTFFLDRIHPTGAGADIIQRAMMEALGEVRVPAAGTVAGVQVGLLRRVAELEPSVATVVAGAVAQPDSALTRDDVGASLPPGSELRLSGFALPAGVTPRALVVHARFRTTGGFSDDSYRIEASVLGFQRPATLDVTSWDYLSPVAGGSGTIGSGQGVGASLVNALSDRPAWVEVAARLTLNAVDDGTATGAYAWPDPTAADVAALQVRLRVEATGAPDPAEVEWDAAWVEVIGQAAPVGPTVGEVSDVRSGEAPLVASAEAAGIALAWEAEPNAAIYRLYRGLLPARTGDAAAFESASAGPRCTDRTAWLDADASGSVFWLVSALDGAGLEGPVGFRSDGAARPTAGADCP